MVGPSSVSLPGFFSAQALIFSLDGIPRDRGGLLAVRSVLPRLHDRFRLGLVLDRRLTNSHSALKRLEREMPWDEVLLLPPRGRRGSSVKIYLQAAARLGVEPKDCLVVGARDVLEAGMRTLREPNREEVLRLPGCLRNRAPRIVRGAAEAVKILKKGQLAVIPTDTVYGLASLPSLAAVRWIYRAKRRPEDNPLVLLLASGNLARRYAEVDERARELIRRFWPGGLTLVLPARRRSAWGRITRGGDWVALRVPDHPLTRAIVRGAGGALATSSANPSGEPTPVRVGDLDAGMLGFCAAVVDGGDGTSTPSTVVKLTGKKIRILRQGTVIL